MATIPAVRRDSEIQIFSRDYRDECFAILVRPERLELPAYWFEASRSIQLSYGRTFSMAYEELGHIRATDLRGAPRPC